MKNHPAILLLILLGALPALSIDIYLPSMGAIAEDLGTGMSQIQWTLSVFLLGFGGGQLVYGPISDRFGRKQPLLWGLGLYLAANLICAVAPNGATMVVGRFLQGLGACCGAVSSIAITRDLYSGSKLTLTLARMATAISLVSVLAPLLGAWLGSVLGWRFSFYFLLLVVVCLLWVCIARLPETVSSTRVVQLRYRQILGSSAFRDYSFLSGFAFAALFAFMAMASPILMGNFGISAQNFALLFASNAVIYLIGSFAAGKLSKRHSLPQMALSGSSLILAGGLLMGIAGGGHPIALMLPMFAVTFGVAVTSVAGTSGAMAPFGDGAGGATALFGFLRFAMAGIVGWIVGLQVADSGRLAITITFCGAACLMASLSRSVAAKRVQLEPSFPH